MSPLRGILPAIVTPLDSADTFQPHAFARLLEHVYSNGADGIYVCGQTGEGLAQPVEQRKRVAEAAVDLSPAGKSVVIHVRAGSTRDAIALRRHPRPIGATPMRSAPAPGG